MTDDHDRVTAALNDLKVEASLGRDARVMPHLFAALDRALALADEWRETATELDQRSAKAADEGDTARSAILSYRAQAHTDCAARLDRVIAAALLGEASGE